MRTYKAAHGTPPKTRRSEGKEETARGYDSLDVAATMSASQTFAL